MAEVQSKSTKLCPQCLPDCNHIAYSTSTTSAEFRYHIKLATLYIGSLSRRCDSRNLNLSPFCSLESSSAPMKLKPTVEATYGSKAIIDTNYVQDLPTPMRKEYPLESMASNEILSFLAEVFLHPFMSKEMSKHVNRMTQNTTHMREISPLSTFSFLTQQCLVSL